ncbi:unnamed protein product [Moneuplotes crassus]|uniref:Uncharacterized protein n=1 Tax=Euplotes crassus TaxID=5936 RepID=A0AAD1XMZ9_EUPCR|nr:unnamed protein product [Moneuplotes crassus]
METSIENFFNKNCTFPSDVKRRLNTINILDGKLEILQQKYERLKAQFAVNPYNKEIFTSIEGIYKQMKAIQQEKYDHSVTAFMIYEQALRQTDKFMSNLNPRQITPRSVANSADNPYEYENFMMQDLEEKPSKTRRSRSFTKKELKHPRSDSNTTTPPNYPEVKEEFKEPYPVMSKPEENPICPCGEVKNDDWTGCESEIFFQSTADHRS